MAVHLLHSVQKIPSTLEKTWDFFASPENLKLITPEKINFKILNEFILPERMYPGQIISYKVHPIMGIPLFWMTEITHVDQGKLFVDEQKKGPFKLWHHQHHFKEIAGGVEMTDILHYKMPLWILGDFAHLIYIKKEITDIFKYRKQKIEELLGKY